MCDSGCFEHVVIGAPGPQFVDIVVGGELVFDGELAINNSWFAVSIVGINKHVGERSVMCVMPYELVVGSVNLL
jgi:hypothetical protein